MEFAVKILIIIPCYNEEKRLPIAEFEHFFNSKRSEHTSFMFVNDGSTDNTEDILYKLTTKYQQVEFLSLKNNKGKAEAIRQGILHLQLRKNKYAYIGYFDADLAAPLTEIGTLTKHINPSSKPYMLLGARVKLLGSTFIKRKIIRHYIGRVFATIVSNILNLSIYDTQCGAKLIKKDVAYLAFKDPFISKWLFDVELLFRIKSQYKTIENKIIEVPLSRWEDKSGSKIKSTYYIIAPIDLLRIYLKYG